jgi:hypothetical protein
MVYYVGMDKTREGYEKDIESILTIVRVALEVLADTAPLFLQPDSALDGIKVDLGVIVLGQHQWLEFEQLASSRGMPLKIDDKDHERHMSGSPAGTFRLGCVSGRVVCPRPEDD